MANEESANVLAISTMVITHSNKRIVDVFVVVVVVFHLPRMNVIIINSAVQDTNLMKCRRIVYLFTHCLNKVVQWARQGSRVCLFKLKILTMKQNVEMRHRSRSTLIVWWQCGSTRIGFGLLLYYRPVLLMTLNRLVCVLCGLDLNTLKWKWDIIFRSTSLLTWTDFSQTYFLCFFN